MDQLRKMKMMMDMMASKEGIISEDFISKNKNFFSEIENNLYDLQSGDETAGEKLEQGKEKTEKEISRYIEFLERIDTMMENQKKLPEKVRIVTEVLMGKIKSGIEKYLEAYEEISLALEEEEPAYCKRAKELFSEGEKTISKIQGEIERAKDEIPVDLY